MRSFLPGRQRAEHFAQLVDGARTTHDPNLAPLLSVVERLSRPTPITPDAEFAAQLREQLRTEMAEVPAAQDVATRSPSSAGTQRPAPRSSADPGGPIRRRLSTPPRTRLLAVATAVSLIAGIAGIAAFAGNAMPGEALYGLKRGLEQTQTAISTNSESRGRQYLASGRARLHELTALVERNEAGAAEEEGHPRTVDPSRVALARSTLEDFTEQTRNGGDLMLDAYQADQRTSSLTQLQKFTAESGKQLVDLAPLLPEELGNTFTDATRTLLSIDQRIGTFCPECVSLTRPDRDTDDQTKAPDVESPSPKPTDSPTVTSTPSPIPSDEMPSPGGGPGPNPPDDGGPLPTLLPLPTKLPLPGLGLSGSSDPDKGLLSLDGFFGSRSEDSSGDSPEREPTEPSSKPSEKPSTSPTPTGPSSSPRPSETPTEDDDGLELPIPLPLPDIF